MLYHSSMLERNLKFDFVNDVGFHVLPVAGEWVIDLRHVYTKVFES
jgi:hypothetical protein